ncbi:MAG TPA: DUF523 domain-containing protein [Firmicutes bacterium]|nr:DUF523 domain-containing protein [Bacillota bacterium]
MSAGQKPVIVVSKCLGFAVCRYNGVPLEAEYMQELAQFVDLIPVCPEVEIGLPVPRDPIWVIQTDEGKRLVQPTTKRDLTDLMVGFAERFAADLEYVDGFILKSRSPSCGISDCKLFNKPSLDRQIGVTSGFFAAKVMERFPGCAFISEKGMLDPKARQEFLQQVFESARKRAVNSME